MSTMSSEPYDLIVIGAEIIDADHLLTGKGTNRPVSGSTGRALSAGDRSRELSRVGQLRACGRRRRGWVVETASGS